MNVQSDSRASPTPRRSHRKSRTGCNTCKRRRIKCDEHRPSCRNCSRHGTGCDFVHDSGAPSPSRQLSNGAGNGDLGMLDLELMHHYTASTYTTLSADPTIRSLWRGPVVRMALGCPYLMRAVLAVSALHLAHYRPEAKDRYLCVALQHHQLASRHAAALMSDLSRVEGENLFVFSVLTMVFALASSKNAPGDLPLFGEAGFPGWLLLFGGPKSLTEAMGDDLKKGVLAPLFARAARRWLLLHEDGDNSSGEAAAGEADGETAPMDELQAHIAAAVGGDAEALRVYTFAVDELRGSLRAAAARRGLLDVTDCFAWVYAVLDDFLPLLRAREPEAVAVFAHFCVLLKPLDAYWWMQGWADLVMHKAYQLLDQEHRLWLRWPAEEIGWVPPGP